MSEDIIGTLPPGANPLGVTGGVFAWFLINGNASRVDTNADGNIDYISVPVLALFPGQVWTTLRVDRVAGVSDPQWGKNNAEKNNMMYVMQPLASVVAYGDQDPVDKTMFVATKLRRILTEFVQGWN